MYMYIYVYIYIYGLIDMHRYRRPQCRSLFEGDIYAYLPVLGGWWAGGFCWTRAFFGGSSGATLQREPSFQCL